MINTFFYTLGQGVKNVFRNKWFTMASLATISACLFVFGIFVAVVFNVNHIVKTVEEGVSVVAEEEPGGQLCALRVGEEAPVLGGSVPDGGADAR